MEGVRELKELYTSLCKQDWQSSFVEYSTTHGVQWKFTPEQTPHFGGLWEAAVKSFKSDVRRVVGEVKLNFEELTTVIEQVEQCLNSRRLTPLPQAPDDLKVLTPDHFVVDQPLEALPDHLPSEQSIPTLR